MSKDRKLSSNGITDGVIWEQLLLFFFPIYKQRTRNSVRWSLLT